MTISVDPLPGLASVIVAGLRERTVGFSGTRFGMTEPQSRAVAALLLGLRESFAIFRHGDCVGADDVAAASAFSLGFMVWVHPGPGGRFAGCWRDRSASDGVTVFAPDGYRERDLAIVLGSSLLVAAPRGREKDEPRSGTWATVRYARKAGIRVLLAWPDGGTHEDVRVIPAEIFCACCREAGCPSDPLISSGPPVECVECGGSCVCLGCCVEDRP